MDSKDFKQAEPLLSEELTFLRKDGKEEYRVPGAEGQYVDALIGNGKYTDAVKILERQLKDIDNDRDKLDALDRLTTAYEKLGKNPEAERAKKAADAIRKGLPPDHYQTPAKVAR
ncbi:MAG: hypothetical protein K2Z81_23335 [Cyanobacteria bacterium]|nr:hypothetical protein [Cyanobacteriota bacterium]